MSGSCLAVVELQSKDMPCTGEAPSIHHFFNEAVKLFKKDVHVLFAFTVAGERCLIAVLQCETWQHIDNFATSIQKISSDIFFTVNPVIEYEKFAEFLGLDSSQIVAPLRKFSSDKHIFLLEFNVNFPGKTTEDLKAIWKEESLAVMTERAKGLEVEAFKVVNERRVYVFMNLDAYGVDALSFGLPIFQHLGSDVVTRCKPVIFV